MGEKILKLVERKTWGSGQSCHLRSSYDDGYGLKVKANIRVDSSYPEQSRITAVVWSPEHRR